ncbi:MAG TPA: alpha/beta hydrolase [Mycobacteriales bacterium]|jgi:pimeloyl-ACP methyl ester carboxylesterase|nr:alpha/beta hydrolase [Mycobacteriales bacterium]
MTESPTPVVFIHGLWLHHTSWGPWQELFAENGYAPIAPGWPGEEATVAATRANPAPMAGYGVVEVANHYAEVITALPQRPIVIGHSFGGLVAQILLGRGLADAAVAIDPAPIKGVQVLPISALRVASIALRNPANSGKTVGLSLEEFTYGFANNRTPAEASSLYDSWAMPSPGKPLFQAASANFNLHAATTVDLHNSHRGPLLITLGGKDHTVPPAISKSTYKLHHRKSSAVTELIEFPDADHSLTVDSDWRKIADAALGWLKKQNR